MSLLKSLTEAYHTVCFGNDEPDILRVSLPLRLKLQEQDWYHNYLHENGRITNFMNASVRVDRTLADDEFVFENSRHPEGSLHHDRFRIQSKVEW